MKMDLSLIEVRMFTPFLVRKQLVTFRSHALSLSSLMSTGETFYFTGYIKLVSPGLHSSSEILHQNVSCQLILTCNLMFSLACSLIEKGCGCRCNIIIVVSSAILSQSNHSVCKN